MTSLVRLLPVTTLFVLALGKSFISYAALGDSYATGNGAGSPKLLPHFDIGCGKYNGAYPIQIAHDLHFAFRNLACAGSITSSVLKTQVPLAHDIDVVSVQVGGNEVDFFGLLNECVQQWRPLSTCENEIETARGLIESTTFIDSYDRLISGAMNQLGPDVQFLVLGYARFFNDRTDQCNHISFSRTDPGNVLTNRIRTTFNEVLLMLNQVIQAAAEAHGAIYVDIDGLFEGHRFCEDEVMEPAPDGSWFFNDPDTTLGIHHDRVHRQTLLNSQGFGDFVNLTRTFHPTSDGHRAIADKIIELLHTL